MSSPAVIKQASITPRSLRTEVESSSQLIGIVLGATFVLIVVFLIDKKNNHRYSRALRGIIGDLIIKLRAKKKRKSELRQIVNVQEPPSTPKHHAEHDRKNQVPNKLADFIKEEKVLPEEIQSDTPEADFKGVFQIKESKCKHKLNKKSKSKLKGRLLGKGSDEEEQPQGERSTLIQQVEGSTLMQDNSLEKSAETEDIKVQNLQ